MKQFLISAVVMFILSLGLGFVVHGLLLKDDYAKLTNLMRDEAGQQQHFPAMLGQTKTCAQQRLRGGSAQAHDHFRLDRGDLGFEPWAAGFHFAR